MIQVTILSRRLDFSAEGAIEHKPPAVDGKQTDLDEFMNDLGQVARMISEASARRDRLNAEKDKKRQ
jgi:hypothetical protein